MSTDRDAAAADRDAAGTGRDAAGTGRDAAATDRDAAATDRDAAATDRDGAIAAACAAWPAIDVARFRGHVAALGAPEAVVAIEDLALAFACGAGDAGALARLESEHFGAIRAALARRGRAGAAIDEVMQLLRHEVLIAPAGGEPRILRYAGRGPLRGWLRAVATRIALREAPVGEALDEERDAPAGDDLELAYMRKTYGAAFQRAFAAALAALAADERLLLKQRFQHRLTVEELGRVHGVHAGTVSRWVTAARERLVKATRAQMVRELGVGGPDLESILRLIRSQIELSLSSRG